MSRLPDPQNQSNQSNRTNFFISPSPLVRRISKIRENSTDCATYSGIRWKCLYFLGMVLVGAAVGIAVSHIPWNRGIWINNWIFVGYLQLGILAAVMLAMIVCPIIASIKIRTTPVLGSISCAANGYLLGFMAQVFPDYQGPMLIALVMTFALVFSMLILFCSGKVKVTKKFRTVVFSSLMTFCVGSLLLTICAFIPGLQAISMAFRDNPALSIGFAVVGVVIASLFLLVDFDTVQRTVESRMPKQYEWLAAFSLSFTVIWLYFKVLDLILRVQNARR